MMLTQILIIEDDERIADMLDLYLQHLGYDIIVANNGEDGVTLTQALQPNLILCDVMLPDISGIEVFSFIREFTNIPVIFMSAQRDYERVIGQLSAHSVDFISKPFRFEELDMRIQHFLA